MEGTAPQPIETIPPAESIITEALSSEPKLWAGKYKSPEDLENAYKQTAGIYNENVELKKQLETFVNIPTDYAAPQSSSLRQNELDEIKQMAKNAGLSQVHFDKMAQEMESKIRNNIELFEKAKNDVGQDKLNVLSEYVKNYYPETLHDHVINKLIKDKVAMTDALNHRDKLLNTTVPGVSSGSTVMPKTYDGQAECEKAAIEYRKNPSVSNRQRYMDLAEQVGRERFKK